MIFPSPPVPPEGFLSFILSNLMPRSPSPPPTASLLQLHLAAPGGVHGGGAHAPGGHLGGVHGPGHLGGGHGGHVGGGHGGHVGGGPGGHLGQFQPAHPHLSHPPPPG